MDEVPPEEFSVAPKTRFLRGRKDQVFVMAFVTVVTLSILTMVLFASYVQQSNKSPAGVVDINDASWSITRIEPSNGSTTDVDLTVTSSIGNVRHYNSVRSYGLSNDRQMLVLSNSTALTLVNLSDDKKTKLKPSFDYAGDMGQAISWTTDDQFFAMAVYKGQDPSDTHVVVYSKTGEVIKDIAGTFTTYPQSGTVALFPIKFSPSRNLFIARVYKTEDKDYYKSQNMGLNQLPVLLRVYNLEGVAIKEVSVRDATTTPSNVVYFWDQTGTYLNYLVSGTTAEINYADDRQFIKIAI